MDAYPCVRFQKIDGRIDLKPEMTKSHQIFTNREYLQVFYQIIDYLLHLPKPLKEKGLLSNPKGKKPFRIYFLIDLGTVDSLKPKDLF